MFLPVAVVNTEHAMNPLDVGVDRTIGQFREVAIAAFDHGATLDVFEVAVERQALLSTDGAGEFRIEHQLGTQFAFVGTFEILVACD